MNINFVYITSVDRIEGQELRSLVFSFIYFSFFFVKLINEKKIVIISTLSMLF